VRSYECPGQHLFSGAFRPRQPATGGAREWPPSTPILGCGWGASGNLGVRKGCGIGSASPHETACVRTKCAPPSVAPRPARKVGQLGGELISQRSQSGTRCRKVSTSGPAVSAVVPSCEVYSIHQG